MLAAIAFLVVACGTAVAVANALRPSKAWLLLVPSWFFAWVTIELAWHLIVGAALVSAGFVALGALDETVGRIALVLMAASCAGLAAIGVRSHRTLIQVRGAMEELEPDHDEAPRFPWLHILVPPLVFWRRGVRHDRGIVYGRAGGKRQRLDVYLPAAPSGEPHPAIVYVHGGAWLWGSRREQGVPLLNHMAAAGWVGFNVDYRLSPHATWPDHVVDVKRSIAWVREHAERYGVDPSFVAVAGGSAGGHLAALAALTPGDPEFQPGFEDADTSIQAAVPFYGIYDLLDEHDVYPWRFHAWMLEPWIFKVRVEEDPDRFRRASPVHRVGPHAPPFMVVHGTGDSLVPTSDAQRFVERLRESSREPVLYAEMQGAQHAFEVFPSVRSARVIEGIERFLTTVWERRGAAQPELEREVEQAAT